MINIKISEVNHGWSMYINNLCIRHEYLKANRLPFSFLFIILFAVSNVAIGADNGATHIRPAFLMNRANQQQAIAKQNRIQGARNNTTQQVSPLQQRLNNARHYSRNARSNIKNSPTSIAPANSPLHQHLDFVKRFHARAPANSYIPSSPLMDRVGVKRKYKVTTGLAKTNQPNPCAISPLAQRLRRHGVVISSMPGCN